jgi:hypothetical protein
MRVHVLALVLLSGCAADVSGVINIAPSAEGKAEEIAEAADEMNDLADLRVFEVHVVDREYYSIDDQIVIRMNDGAISPRNKRRIGLTDRTPGGVIISLTERCDVLCIMHELGHAVGLRHVKDRENLMFRASLVGAEITRHQRRVIREAYGVGRDGRKNTFEEEE